MATLAVFLLLGAPTEAASREVRIATIGSHPTGAEKPDRLHEFIKSVLGEVARLEGWKVSFVCLNGDEAWDQLDDGRLDLLAGVPFIPDNDQRGSFGREGIVSTWGQIFTGPSVKVQSLLDLDRKRVGMIENDALNTVLRRTLQRLGTICSFVELKTPKDMFEALAKGWIEVAVADRFMGPTPGRSDHLVQTPVIFFPQDLRMASARHHNMDLLAAIDHHLGQLKSRQDSLYYRQLDKLLGVDPLKKLPAYVKWTLLIISAALILSLGFGWVLRRQVKTKTAELRLRNQELTQSEARYRAMFENAGAATIIFEKDLTISMLNARAAELAGMPKETIEGQRRISEFLSADHQLLLQQPVATLEGKSQEIRIIDGSGCNRSVSFTVAPIPGSDRHIASIIDLTAQKQLERRLMQSQKMEAIGRLSGGIAHDFNNILAAIIGFTELAIMDAQEGRPVTARFAKILASATRAKDLVNQILAFSRQSEPERRVLCLADEVRQALKLLRPSIAANVEIHHRIEDEKGQILADTTHLHQIVMNLCTNAAHAMLEKGGQLHVGVARTSIGAADAKSQGLPPGDYMVLTIRDTGHGMDPSTMDKIFDPFFTTKPLGQGTGMGLSVVHGILAGYGGTIKVASQIGKGTCFEVVFPAIAGLQTFDNPKQINITGGKERVLLVDDDALMAESAQETIASLGYRVTMKNDSREALALFARQPDDFDLVVTDMTMPKLTGAEMSRRMLAIRSDIPILMCTGYSEIITPEKAIASGIREFVYKPLTKSELAAAIRKALEAKTDTTGTLPRPN